MQQFDISKLPRWIFAFAALIISITVAYGMFYAKCTTNLFGVAFGQSRPCERADYEVLHKLKTLENQNAILSESIRKMGTRDRNSVSLVITNRSGGDTKGCPEGTYVSAISAPGGVNGKYATRL